MLYHHKTHNVYIDNSYPVSKNKNVFISENLYKHKNKAINQIEKLSLGYFITVLCCNSRICVKNLNANKKKNINRVIKMYLGKNIRNKLLNENYNIFKYLCV